VSGDPTSRAKERIEKPIGPFVVTADGVVLYSPPGFELPPGTVSWQDWLDEELSEEQKR
jgi:hypothetical protein